MPADVRDETAAGSVIAVIPEGVEAISPEWLNATLRGVAPDARASSVEVVDAHSGTTGRARLAVSWDSGDLPSTVFVKLPPTEPLQRAMVVETGMGTREARFYRELAGEVPVRVPRPLGSWWTEDRRDYLMLIEDLKGSGCSFPGFESGADLAVVRSAVEGLARLHAAFWESTRFDADLAWVEPPMHSEMGPQLVARGAKDFGDEQPEAFHAMAELYTRNGAAFADRLAAGPQTLMHGDPHLGNLFLDGGTVGFLDWACVCRGPGLRDVAYLLCASVETDLRRAEEEALLRGYLEALAVADAPAPGFDDAWREYRCFAAAGWVASVATFALGDALQSAEVGRRAMARANATVADLGTSELIRADLGVDD
jgi:aminoglycoside phosphotransferase (APT) family kinase protein